MMDKAKHTSEKVFVTGGGGFLGKAIVKRLIARGDQVISFSRSDYPAVRELGATVVRGDLQDSKAVQKASEGCELIFHVAAKVGVWGKYEDFYNTNVKGTENVLAACHKNEVKRLVYTSSPSVIFDGGDMEGIDESVPYPSSYLTFYPKTKAEAERKVKAASKEGIETAILRPHLIWGPEDNHLVPRILARSKALRIIGDGQNLIDTIYIDNAADAHILAADQLKREPSKVSGKAYFISQDEPILLWEMINLILKAGGKPPVTKKISKKLAYSIGATMEFVYRLFGVKSEPRMTRFVAKELSTSHWFSIQAARNDFNYVPKVSTEEGLKRLEDWLRMST